MPTHRPTVRVFSEERLPLSVTSSTCYRCARASVLHDELHTEVAVSVIFPGFLLLPLLRLFQPWKLISDAPRDMRSIEARCQTSSCIADYSLTPFSHHIGYSQAHWHPHLHIYDAYRSTCAVKCYTYATKMLKANLVLCYMIGKNVLPRC